MEQKKRHQITNSHPVHFLDHHKQIPDSGIVKFMMTVNCKHYEKHELGAIQQSNVEILFYLGKVLKLFLIVFCCCSELVLF